MRMKVLFGVSMLASLCGISQNAAEVVATGDFWKADKAVYGDGRVPSDSHKPDDKIKPHGFRLDYRIKIPETGWHELFFSKAGGDLAHDVEIDGKLVYLARCVDTADKDGFGKASNLWIEAGDHVLRVKRTGRNSFPQMIFDRFELRRAAPGAMSSVMAEKAGHDVLRKGESLQLRLTAGGNKMKSTYSLFRNDQMATAGTGEKVAEVEFPESDSPQSKIVEIACPQEGVFSITAQADGKRLPQSGFPNCMYAVVDTTPEKKSTGNEQNKVLHDIDCVSQTDLGKPLADGAFTECNGPTRVSKTAAGEYRESHDCTPPEAEDNPMTPNKTLSGFAYKIDVPAGASPLPA